MPTLPSVAAALRAEGFVFVDGAGMRTVLGGDAALPDWDAFAGSWDDLEVDRFMADGGRYRRRRHAMYTAHSTGAIVRRPHGPHWQSLDYNSLNGGIERWFEPITDSIGASQSMSTILAWCHELFGSLSRASATWHLEVHQFRIEARAGEPAQPTPEGLHRDGVDWVLVLLIHRRNIVSGTTTIHTPSGEQLGSFTLRAPFDTALVDDARLCHGVTAVQAVDPARPAYRDVLVVTFRAA